MDDVDKLDNIQDGFIHYQLLRFCQATRLQYLNGQIDLANQNILQQQHVDHKIANALLKKGTRGGSAVANSEFVRKVRNPGEDNGKAHRRTAAGERARIYSSIPCAAPGGIA